MCKDCETCERCLVKQDTCNLPITNKPSIIYYECCPWPSKRVEKPSKYEEAYKLWCKKMSDDVCSGLKEFEDCCRKVGLV